ncbi:MAG: hypothetical protein OIF48_02145 [Silicimonas sp.]|nr:hypothetical protein [Silicimonas sp.]
MKALRKAEAGTLRAPALGGDVFARLDGVPVVLRPQINETVMTGKITPVAYRYFTLSLDGQVSIGLLTNADDAAVLALLSGMDMAGLQASLPVESRGFAAGTGIVPAGPASEG